MKSSLTIDVVFMPQAGITASVKEDAYRQKALRTFFKFGRVEAIPVQLKKFLIILEQLAEEFEPGRTYTEREVNQALVEFNDDVAMLRRGLIDAGLLERENSIYWRVMDAKTEAPPAA